MQFLLSFFFLIFSPLAFAKTVPTEILEKKFKAYQNIATLRAKFQETKQIKDLGVKLKSEGELFIDRTAKRKIIWKVFKPSPLELTIEDSTIEIVSNGKKETYGPNELSNDKAAQGLASLRAWLDLDIPRLVSQYEVEETATDQYRFTPKQEAPFKNVRLWVSPAGHLRKLSMAEVSGDNLDLEFGAPSIKQKRKKD